VDQWIAAIGRRAVIPAGLLTLAWLVATHVPQPAAARLNIFESDWLAHGSGYLVLGACWMLYVSARFPASLLRCGLPVWAAMIAFGAIDETTQPIVGRSCSLSDWISDAVGSAVGIAGMGALLYRLAPRSRKEEVLDDIHDRVHVAEHHPERHDP
jgi:VanZ family protein